MRTTILPSLFIVVALSTSGCVQTAMLPADTLEDGETRVSVTAREPGALIIPHLTAQVTQGYGAGDVTVNLSAVPVSEDPMLGGGLAVRSYLTRNLSLEAQLQGTSFSGRPAGLALFGLQALPPSDGGWYAGGQTGIVRGPSPDIMFDDPPPDPRTWTAPVIGGTVGYGPIKQGRQTRIQIELKANMPLWGDEGEPPIPATGISVGFYGLLD